MPLASKSSVEGHEQSLTKSVLIRNLIRAEILIGLLGGSETAKVAVGVDTWTSLTTSPRHPEPWQTPHPTADRRLELSEATHEKPMWSPQGPQEWGLHTPAAAPAWRDTEDDTFSSSCEVQIGASVKDSHCSQPACRALDLLQCFIQ
jgi:hypothetical protein